MKMEWPQITIIVLYSITALLTAYMHGKPQTGKHNVFFMLPSIALYITILYFGGFFTK